MRHIWVLTVSAVMLIQIWAQQRRRYVVCVSEKTAAMDGWCGVLATPKGKHCTTVLKRRSKSL